MNKDRVQGEKAVPGLTRLVVIEAGNLADHGDTPRATRLIDDCGLNDPTYNLRTSFINVHDRGRRGRDHAKFSL